MHFSEILPPGFVFAKFFLEFSGARGRNRTTDTRIFNKDGNKSLNKYNDLHGY